MDRENIQKAVELNAKLTELEEFYGQTGSLEITVCVSNGGEGNYHKKILAEIHNEAKEFILKLLSSKMSSLKDELKALK